MPTRATSFAGTLAIGIALVGCSEDVESPVAALESTAVAADSRSAAECQNVRGTIEGISIPSFDGADLVGFEVIGTGVTGPLAGGTITATLDIETITPGGTIHFTGGHTFENTSIGSFSTSDEGITTGNGRVHDSLTLVEGGSGMLQTRGTVDLASGELVLSYHGRICGTED